MQGMLDSPLTPEGIAQASRLAEKLVASDARTVCTSPLGRALRTAVNIAERIGAELIEVPELAEIDHGQLAGMTWDDVDEAFPGLREERAANRYGWAFPGGESYAQGRSRARRALTACGWASSGTPVLVTHEMMGRMLRAELRGLDVPGALALRHPHDMVVRIEHGAESVL